MRVELFKDIRAKGSASTMAHSHSWQIGASLCVALSVSQNSSRLLPRDNDHKREQGRKCYAFYNLPGHPYLMWEYSTIGREYQEGATLEAVYHSLL